MARTPDAGALPERDLAAPAHATLWATLVYIVASFLLGYPALAGKFLINARSDQYLAGYAFRNFAAQSLKSGHGIPQWSPFIEGGMPYIAAMHGDIFYPTALMRWVLPTDVAMTWEFIIHLILAGLFTYLFLRAWRVSFWAALIGGLAYMLSGSIAGLASPGHDGKLFVATLLPAGLLLLTRGIRDGRLWAWGGFSVVVGLAFLSPHPQVFQYFLILAGAFSLYVAFAAHPELGGKLPRDVALRRIGFALGAVILGCIIGAVQYWPSLIEYKPWSPRAGGHSYAEATSYSFPLEETLNWYWPQFTGILDSYWGRNGIHLHSDYFGVVALILAGASFGQVRRKNFRNFWIGAFVASLLWSYGGFTPLYHLIILIPYTKYLRAPSTMIYITAFSVAVLAAIGVERLIERRVSPKYGVAWGIAAAAFALLMTAGGYTALSGALSDSIASYRFMGGAGPAPSQYVDAVQQLAQANAGAAIAGVWRSFVFAALAAALVWAFVTQRASGRAILVGLAVLVAVDLWSVERLYWIFSPPASQLFPTDPAIEAIKADIAKTGVPGRVVNIAPGGNIGTELGRQDRAFTGDKLWIHGLRITGGYHGNELGMYDRLMNADTSGPGQIQVFPQFWRHENVRYWYTTADESIMSQLASGLHIAPFTKIAGPARDAAGSTVYAYKVPTDNPPAWVASVIVKAPQDQALATVLNERFDPRTAAIADTSDTYIAGVQVQTLPAAATTTARVTSYAPGAITVALDQPAAAGQALVVSENYFPGWHATADGKAVPVGLMNYNLVGVPLPAGAKTIQLQFTDAAYEKGKIVTWVAALVAIVLWVLGAVVDRRRSAPTPATA